MRREQTQREPPVRHRTHTTHSHLFLGTTQSLIANVFNCSLPAEGTVDSQSYFSQFTKCHTIMFIIITFCSDYTTNSILGNKMFFSTGGTNVIIALMTE